jgi:hypothetical protein
VSALIFRVHANGEGECVSGDARECWHDPVERFDGGLVLGP